MQQSKQGLKTLRNFTRFEAHRVTFQCPKCKKLNEIYWSHYQVITQGGTKDAIIQCKDKHWISLKESMNMIKKSAAEAKKKMQYNLRHPNSKYVQDYIEFCLKSKGSNE